MSNHDPIDKAARQQYATLAAARARCEANMREYATTGDDYSLQEEMGTYSILGAQMDRLEKDHRQYHANRNPAPAPEMTEAEWLAASPETMARNPEMIERLYTTSKYYKAGDMAEPELRRRFDAGIAEVQRRKREEGGNR